VLPAFALLLIAAGLGLLLEGDPPGIAYWLACVGVCVGIYLAGTRAFLLAGSRVGGLARLLVLIATFQVARLRPELSPHAFLWLLTAWAAMCAALTTRGGGEESDDLARYLGGRGARAE
jgi:hypothetical protein